MENVLFASAQNQLIITTQSQAPSVFRLEDRQRILSLKGAKFSKVDKKE